MYILNFELYNIYVFIELYITRMLDFSFIYLNKSYVEVCDNAINNEINSNEDNKQNIIENETICEKFKGLTTNVRYEIAKFKQNVCFQDKLDIASDGYLLGKHYKFMVEFADSEKKDYNYIKLKYKIDFSNILWFSYRRNFPGLLSLTPTTSVSYTNDVMWGCMIRSAQMIIAQCLQKSKIKEDDIIALFLDKERDEYLAPFSIQTISKYIYANYNILPVNWLRATEVLNTLDYINTNIYKNSCFKMIVFVDGLIFIKDILDLMVNDDRTINTFEDFEIIDEDLINYKLQLFGNLGLSSLVDETTSVDEINIKLNIERLLQSNWEQPLLLSLVTSFNKLNNYDSRVPKLQYKFIKELLSLKQFIGMLGGYKGRAYYIVGYIDDNLIYIDPHYVQDAINRDEITTKGNTYHCSNLNYLHYKNLDSSITFCFLIKNECDFRHFIKKYKCICNMQESVLGLELYKDTCNILSESITEYE